MAKIITMAFMSNYAMAIGNINTVCVIWSVFRSYLHSKNPAYGKHWIGIGANSVKMVIVWDQFCIKLCMPKLKPKDKSCSRMLIKSLSARNPWIFNNNKLRCPWQGCQDVCPSPVTPKLRRMKTSSQRDSSLNSLNKNWRKKNLWPENSLSWT